jgi:hypothetical protein
LIDLIYPDNTDLLDIGLKSFELAGGRNLPIGILNFLLQAIAITRKALNRGNYNFLLNLGLGFYIQILEMFIVYQFILF